MKKIKTYFKVFLLFLNMPFAFTRGTKQRIRKEAKLLLNEV